MSSSQDQKDLISELKNNSALGLKDYFDKEFPRIKDQCLKDAREGSMSTMFTWSYSPVLESKTQKEKLSELLVKEGFTLSSINGVCIYLSEKGDYKTKLSW